MSSNLILVNVAGFTPQGIERMAKVIRATLQVRAWTERELTRAIQARAKQLKRPELSLSPGTINRYASLPPVVKRPQLDVLEAIAPFMFRVLSIKGDQVELDTSRTYEDDWREFARIGTSAFEDSLTDSRMSRVQKSGSGKINPKIQGAEMVNCPVANLIKSKLETTSRSEFVGLIQQRIKNFSEARLTDLIDGSERFSRHELEVVAAALNYGSDTNWTGTLLEALQASVGCTEKNNGNGALRS